MGSEKLKKEFLPKILNAEIEFAVGYSEPDAGSDAASMKLKAVKDGDGWLLKIKLADTKDLESLMTVAEYRKYIEEEAN